MNTNSISKWFAAFALAAFSLSSAAIAQRPIYPVRPLPIRPIPIRPVPVIPLPAAVQVTASSLNVRTGPGTRFAVVGVVGRGAILNVRGVSGGWLNVVSPRGFVGWISASYTVRVR